MDQATDHELNILNGFFSTSELKTDRLGELLTMKVGEPFKLAVQRDVSDVYSMDYFVQGYLVSGDGTIDKVSVPGREKLPGSGTHVYGVMWDVMVSPKGNKLGVFIPIVDGKPSENIFCTVDLNFLTEEAQPLIIDFDEVPDFLTSTSS